METEITKEQVSKADGKPEDWKTLKIKEIGEVILGTTPSTKVESNWDGSIPFITPGDVSGYKIRDTERTISEEGLDEKRKLPQNSIVVSCIGNIGRVGITQMETAMTNQQINSIIPYEDVADNHFTLFLTDYFGEGFKNYASQTTVPILNKTNFSNIELKVPPLPEQRKIASILTSVRDAIEQTEAVIQATRQLKKSMMKHLFTYGPVPVNQTDQVELEETDIGKVPKEWGVNRIGDVTNGTQYGINKSGNQEGEYPVLRMSNQSDGKIYLDDLQYVDLDDQEFEKYQLKKGEILFNRTNSFELVGKTSIFDHDRDDVVFASYLVRVFPDKDGINPYFLNHYMNKESTQRRLKTVATRAVSQSNINATKLRNFEVPVPNSETQDKIVSELRTIDSKIEQERDKKIALESFFNSLLENLMTAKVRVI